MKSLAFLIPAFTLVGEAAFALCALLRSSSLEFVSPLQQPPTSFKLKTSPQKPPAFLAPSPLIKPYSATLSSVRLSTAASASSAACFAGGGSKGLFFSWLKNASVFPAKDGGPCRETRLVGEPLEKGVRGLYAAAARAAALVKSRLARALGCVRWLLRRVRLAGCSDLVRESFLLQTALAAAVFTAHLLVISPHIWRVPAASWRGARFLLFGEERVVQLDSLVGLGAAVFGASLLFAPKRRRRPTLRRLLLLPSIDDLQRGLPWRVRSSKFSV